MTTLADDIATTTEVREGEYGEKIGVIEPGGAEFIPLNERHGSPLQLFWTCRRTSSSRRCSSGSSAFCTSV
jgi:hypothetical protein